MRQNITQSSYQDLLTAIENAGNEDSVLDISGQQFAADDRESHLKLIYVLEELPERFTEVNLSQSLALLGPMPLYLILAALKSSVTTLNVSQNQLPAAGLTAIVAARKRSVVALDLSHNPIAAGGAISFIAALKSLESVKELNLSHNNLGHQGEWCPHITVAVPPSVKTLDLSGNDLHLLNSATFLPMGQVQKLL